MDKAPLVMDEVEAGEDFLRRLDAHAPVVAACWLRNAEDGERYLYVALDGLTARNADAAYGEVRRIAAEMKDRYIDPFRVRLIGTNDPVARALLDVHRRFPGRVPPRPNVPAIGGVPVGDLYIYPPLVRKP